MPRSEFPQRTPGEVEPGRVEGTIDAMLSTARRAGFFSTKLHNLVALEREEVVSLIEVRAAHHDRGSDSASIGSHLGVWSRRLAGVFGPPDWLPPSWLESRHWRRWSGYIDDENVGDDWLIWDSEPEASQLAVQDFTERVIPALLARSSDAGLYADWSASDDPFLGSFEQVAYLTVLAIGLERPATEIDELRGRLHDAADRGATAARVLIRQLSDAGIRV